LIRTALNMMVVQVTEEHGVIYGFDLGMSQNVEQSIQEVI